MTSHDATLEDIPSRFSSLEQRVNIIPSLEKRVETVQQVLEGSGNQQILEKRLASLEEHRASAVNNGVHALPSEDDEYSSMLTRIQMEHDQMFKHLSQVSNFAQQMTQHVQVLQADHDALKMNF